MHFTDPSAILTVPLERALAWVAGFVLLRTRCERILQDEQQPLLFQAATLGQVREGRGFLSHHPRKSVNPLFGGTSRKRCARPHSSTY